EHHWHGPTESFANDQVGLVAAQPVADLQDHKPGNLLAGHERGDVSRGGQLDADGDRGPLGRSDAWQVNAHKGFLGASEFCRKQTSAVATAGLPKSTSGYRMP